MEASKEVKKVRLANEMVTKEQVDEKKILEEERKIITEEE